MSTRRPLRFSLSLIVALSLCTAAPATAAPSGTLTVAVATFGNERWLPHLYVGAEDVVLKPMYENLLTRWKVADGGRTWTFNLRKGIKFHSGVTVAYAAPLVAPEPWGFSSAAATRRAR